MAGHVNNSQFFYWQDALFLFFFLLCFKEYALKAHSGVRLNSRFKIL